MSFDRLAPHYDWLEALTAGSRLQRARTTWLPALRGRQRILSVGEGHGRFAAACVAAYPDADLTCVEASAGMIARARRRVGANPAAKIHFHHSSLADWTPSPTARYDAIVTCFFLDCFPPDELARIITRLSACAAPDALWLNVDFTLPARGLARWRAKFIHALMYAFFRPATALSARRVTPPDDLLRSHRFTLAGRREFEWGLIRADLWQRG